MRCMSQGGTHSLASPVEYSKRARCRSIKMQHVLPSRNVCVAYHGMTIPLPAPSLCGAFRNSMKEQKTFLTNEAIEGGSKDSGFQSQITTASDVSCTGSVTTSLSGTAVGRCSDQKKGEDKLMQTGNCDTSLCGEVQPVLKLPAECESNVANSSVCLPTEATECTRITEIKTPPTLLSSKVVEEPLSKQVWAHAGRGRALQQLVSQLTQSVGRSQASTADSVPSQMNSVASYGSGSVSPDHPVHGLRKTGLCADTSEKLDAVEEDMAICCNLENPAPFLVPPSPSGSCLSQADNDVSDSVTAENGCGAVSDTKQEACSSPDELVVESNSSTELIDVIATVGCAKSNRCSPEKQIEIETTHLVNEVRAGVPLSGNTSCAEKATYNTGGKTPKSSRKAKISLAIQFKGICTPQLAPERATTSITKGTPCPHEYEGRCKAPSGAVLLKPSDFAQLGPSSVSADKQLDRKECRVADVKNEELMAQANSESEELATECTLGDLQLVRGVEKKEERDVESPVSILTQVSEMEDYDQDLSCGQSGSDDKELEVDPPVARTELNEETLSLEHPRHLSPLSNLVLSSDEDVEESVGSRMGRSADEIEKSIAHHQRNIHRNRMELRRVQRKNRATEESLAADLAEQCCEDLSGNDSLQYSTTHDRETRVDHVVDLQMQFAINSEAVKRRSVGYTTVLEQGNIAYEHDKLTSMELKLEAEAVELEEQLMLAKMEARLLQAKSELLYD